MYLSAVVIIIVLKHFFSILINIQIFSVSVRDFNCVCVWYHVQIFIRFPVVGKINLIYVLSSCKYHDQFTVGKRFQWYPLNMRLGGPQRLFGRFKEDIRLLYIRENEKDFSDIRPVTISLYQQRNTIFHQIGGMMDYANREIRQNKNSPYVATSLTS
jgi:hypothetical protein